MKRNNVKLIEKATAIGSLLLKSNEYSDMYKKGGNQKLQAIIGPKLFFKDDYGDWRYCVALLKRMTVPQIKELIEEVDYAIMLKRPAADFHKKQTN